MKSVVKGALAVALLGVAGAATFWVVQTAKKERADPARCAVGLVAQGPRCCGEGQQWSGSRCIGPPSRCADSMTAEPTGCVAVVRRVRFEGGAASVGPDDWEAEGRVGAREIRVKAFDIDAVEVTEGRWARCVRLGRCSKRPGDEPGLPVRNVDPGAAARFCRAEGGRLPTGDEWLFAALGGEANRFPWGPTGLVCRRAAYGLVGGPCAHGAETPDLAGARPDGTTVSGVRDLAGNVAEWTKELDGSFRARGGSFRARSAADVKSWAAVKASTAAPHIGFRCAYDGAG